ncbi:hypothetical protein P5673_023085 [Acropora cervicornis]|uniref:Uncharacterized protein n=1 Tax=Acropora cervicornis TaxID=6130 RepID=A0AAD9Q5Q6_ACRCE|nr:hypothetical protein P5673_023085 [Acropora cervicornis]
MEYSVFYDALQPFCGPCEVEVKSSLDYRGRGFFTLDDKSSGIAASLTLLQYVRPFMELVASSKGELYTKLCKFSPHVYNNSDELVFKLNAVNLTCAVEFYTVVDTSQSPVHNIPCRSTKWEGPLQKSMVECSQHFFDNEYENGRTSPNGNRGSKVTIKSSYLKAKSWFEDYVDSCADRIPNEDKYCLLTCLTKKEIYLKYADEVRSTGLCLVSRPTFSQMWKARFRNVIIGEQLRINE